MFTLRWLVSGTLRSNLDPFNQHDDKTLWDALKRSYLVESTKPESQDVADDKTNSANKFTLDSVVEEEGGNLSLGQVNLPMPAGSNNIADDLYVVQSALWYPWLAHWSKTRRYSS